MEQRRIPDVEDTAVSANVLVSWVQSAAHDSITE